jgi:hypothetical protein
MAKESNSRKDRPELYPDAWPRFERFIREVAKAGPQHGTAKAKSKRTKSPKAKKKAPPKRG